LNGDIGDVQRQQGDLAGALGSFHAFRATMETVTNADPSNARGQRDLSQSQVMIGDVLRAQGNLPAALTSYQASLAIRERLARADSSDAGLQRDVSVSHERIGDVLGLQRNPMALDRYRM